VFPPNLSLVIVYSPKVVYVMRLSVYIRKNAEYGVETWALETGRGPGF